MALRGVKTGMTITKEQADRILLNQLQRFDPNC